MSKYVCKARPGNKPHSLIVTRTTVYPHYNFAEQFMCQHCMRFFHGTDLQQDHCKAEQEKIDAEGEIQF